MLSSTYKRLDNFDNNASHKKYKKLINDTFISFIKNDQFVLFIDSKEKNTESCILDSKKNIEYHGVCCDNGYTNDLIHFRMDMIDYLLFHTHLKYDAMYLDYTGCAFKIITDLKVIFKNKMLTKNAYIIITTCLRTYTTKSYNANIHNFNKKERLILYDKYKKHHTHLTFDNYIIYLANKYGYQTSYIILNDDNKIQKYNNNIKSTVPLNCNMSYNGGINVHNTDNTSTACLLRIK